MKKLLFILLFFTFLTGCSNDLNESLFNATSISTSNFSKDSVYYIVSDLEYLGKNPATIDKIEIVKADDVIDDYKLIDEFNYSFYIGDKYSRRGVHEELESIGGEVKLAENIIVNKDNALKLILKINTNSNIMKSDNRYIRIKYSVGKETREEILDTKTVNQLETANY
ncbi:hypothetical protein [Lysinibacillus sphaericus]|uniref:Lipoprotein n=1 Tax=Lysinibacillus sphaericus OT4b.31 TaxID=1285586 RepID=R7ZDN9_LYSSH|nr:hypothetical protein [Lysinibacillus sphaericus]EON72265.1 hypothetical protein H131_11838 [Lysinibacillus sphaericus OT4b.31]